MNTRRHDYSTDSNCPRLLQCSRFQTIYLRRQQTESSCLERFAVWSTCFMVDSNCLRLTQSNTANFQDSNMQHTESSHLYVGNLTEPDVLTAPAALTELQAWLINVSLKHLRSSFLPCLRSRFYSFSELSFLFRFIVNVFTCSRV